MARTGSQPIQPVPPYPAGLCRAPYAKYALHTAPDPSSDPIRARGYGAHWAHCELPRSVGYGIDTDPKRHTKRSRPK
ncbi:hypothetical protein N7462_011635 [Penicillium macrosclerotiorum]|uniref:uncharacterized protein n=1 Tax=Penicillium macrosclerotiorum TaxID=303699 RepID=UPI0025486B00|nr:uncharacterized protein N7462_011635 [Penicillium macrosclerotiorum]KAJ5662709.1 hypothetical protein N7462_011635 [Penicillium macrosclerotiorum]